MWTVKQVIVISDLHITPIAVNNLFTAENELSAFFSHIHDYKPDCWVVLAGDTFDFLAPLNENEPPEQSLEISLIQKKITAAVQNRPNLFRSLVRLINSPRHRVVILSGNHDAELAYPAVRWAFENALISISQRDPKENGQRSEVVYRPGGILWNTQGLPVCFVVQGRRILIAHGDHDDSWNCIDHSALRNAASIHTWGFNERKTKSFQPKSPPGSELVLLYLNYLKQDPSLWWIDHLQPLHEAVLPMLIELLPAEKKWEIRKLIKTYLRAQTRSALYKVRRELFPTTAYRGNDSLLAQNQLLCDFLQTPSRSDWSASSEVPQERLLKLIARLREVAAKDLSFELLAPDENEDDVPFVLEHTNTDILIYGHTHQRRFRAFHNGLYLNTGTWIDLLKLPSPQDDDETWLRFLEQPSAPEFKVQNTRTFASIAPCQESVEVALHYWSGEQPQLCTPNTRYIMTSGTSS